MTSEPQQAFVWAWLPGAVDPVVAGRLDAEGQVLTFTYGRSYLERKDRIALYLPELPLGRGPIPPRVGETAGCIADAGPDAWGQRVILNRLTGNTSVDTSDLTPLTYLLESGSERTGAIDFQNSATEYVPRSLDQATLEELAESAERVELGVPLSPALDQALLQGSSVGGARPKALLRDDDPGLIAKFSSTTDTYPVVKGEFVAMELARRAGIETAVVELTKALDRDALLVERFDRLDGGRRAMVSALTILGLDELGARYASYADLADQIRARFTGPTATLRELFARITFNILSGNNDDHARNHAAFWDGAELTLTPAYDICPAPRAGGETAQAMAIGGDGYRFSQVAGCVARASTYLLSEADAREIVDHQIETIESGWTDVCDRAGLTEVDRNSFWRRQFLNPYATEGY
jgi:serine/threonine-protein kinase HipA